MQWHVYNFSRIIVRNIRNFGRYISWKEIRTSECQSFQMLIKYSDTNKTDTCKEKHLLKHYDKRYHLEACILLK